jgi:hypothetical protein
MAGARRIGAPGNGTNTAGGICIPAAEWLFEIQTMV